MRFNIPKKESVFIESLENAGFSTYIVGGAVRDLFLDKEPTDIDIATSATPDEICKVLLANHTEIKLDFVGATFGVIIADGIEIATFRKDEYSGNGIAKQAKIEFTRTIEEDLARRDLTINAIALSPKGEIVDPFGGMKDIENKIIRFVGISDNRINEDNCRILRALRFASSLQFEFSSETRRAIKDNIELIKNIAPERVRIEIMKAMKVKEASRFFSLLASFEGLGILIPEFTKQIEHDHGIHHVENVWEHSMCVGDSISPKFPILKLAGYFHDIGKVDSYKWNPEKSKFHFHSHDSIGVPIVRTILERLRFSSEEIDNVSGLVGCHMIGLKSNKTFTKKTVRKALKKFNDAGVSVNDFLRLRFADRRGNVNKEPYDISEIKHYIKSFKHTEIPPFSVTDLALKGGEIIELFNLKPGPVIGDIQRHCLNVIINFGPEFNTKDILVITVTNFLRDK